MHIQWRKEWTVPAAVGASSFVAGVAAGVVGYRIKIDRDVERGLQAMSEIVKASASDVNEDVKPVLIEKPNFSPTHRRAGMEYVEKNPVPDPKQISKEIRRDRMANEFAEAVAPIPSSTELPFVNEEADLVVPEEEEPFEEITPQPVIENVFEIDPNWDQEEEEKNRTDNAPYILHQDEYFRNEKGYRQQSLEWYEGDKILTDEQQVPIYDPSKIVGRLEFGRGSNDPDTVYVRNDEHRAEYEITRSHGSYQSEVMGLYAEQQAEEDELRHSQRITRFRMD